jgi:hypothetical protein
MLTVEKARSGEANSRTRKAIRSPWMAMENILLVMYWVFVNGQTRICSNIPNFLSNQIDVPAETPPIKNWLTIIPEARKRT